MRAWMIGALAFALASAAVSTASANACANACYAEENRCRIATKNSPSCSARLTACLQRCLKR